MVMFWCLLGGAYLPKSLRLLKSIAKLKKQTLVLFDTKDEAHTCVCVVIHKYVIAKHNPPN